MKKILLITTGGTVSCGDGENLLSPSLTGAQLIGFISGVKDIEIEYRDLLFIDSTCIKPEHWVNMAKAVIDGQNNYDGFVITHGTDTLAYTASMLSFMLCSINKPVMITGSMKTVFEKDSDAFKNLTDAVNAAACGQNGVYIVFGGRIIYGTRGYKSSNTANNSFVSLNCPYAGEIKNENPVFYGCQIVKSARISELKYSGQDISAKVAVITVVPSENGDIIRQCANNGYKGIVLCGYGTGGIPGKGWSEAIEYASSHGVITVMVSQCRHGAIIPSRYSVGSDIERLGIISAADSTLESAYCKLLFLLSIYDDSDLIRRIFKENVCDEINIFP